MNIFRVLCTFELEIIMQKNCDQNTQILNIFKIKDNAHFYARVTNFLFNMRAHPTTILFNLHLRLVIFASHKKC